VNTFYLMIEVDDSTKIESKQYQRKQK